MASQAPTDGPPYQGPVLVVMAHPDDPEFFCGGTVARWADEGREVVYCLLTRGDKGADDPGVDPETLAGQREAEQRAAAAVLGVQKVVFLGYRDGELVDDYAIRRDVVRVMRQVRPDTVVTSDPSTYYSFSINHSDHRVAGQVAFDAVWPGTRSALYYPELLRDEGLKPHKVPQVYVAGSQEPDTVVDVTAYFETKINALCEHKSQIGDRDSLVERLRDRMTDPESLGGSPRLVERFKRIELRR